MAISLRDLLDAGTESMREQASTNNLPHEPFTMRELITPQYRVDVTSTGGVEWSNWVGEHDGSRHRHRPSTKEKLISSVVERVYADERIRAVGSGHSHSNAPEPPDDYIDLNPGGPSRRGRGPDSPGTEEGGVNDTLEHNGWLKDVDTLHRHGQLDEDHTTEHLKRLESGIILRRLNRHVLRENGYALENMGSFTGQTIAGAVNTSTHGTGVRLSSISDSVRSVEIATVPASESGDPIVRLYRIEPTDGITDREAFEADTGQHEMELIQDDDIFRSVVVGYGCMGVVYAYTMEVTDNYWLREETSLMPWSELKAEMTENGVEDFLTRNGCRHVMILVNLAAEQVPKDKLIDSAWEDYGEHEAHQDPICLVRRQYESDGFGGTIATSDRKIEPAIDWETGIADERWPPERRKTTPRDVGQELLNQLHPLKPNEGKAKQLHRRFFHPAHNREPFVKKKNETVWYVALRRTRDRGTKNSSEYRHPEPPQPAVSTEIAVPLDDIVAAVDAVRRKVRTVKQGDDIPPGEKNARAIDRDVFFGAPMGIRFTAPSEHFLSPEFERRTAMVEVPLPVNREDNETNAFFRSNVPALTQDEMRNWVVEPALTKLHDHLLEEFPARPHMGKHNTVDAEWLDRTYEYFDASNTERDTGWYQAYERFNAFGTFDNAFTDQLGLDEFAPARPDHTDEPTVTGTETSGRDDPGGDETEPAGQDGSGGDGTESPRRDDSGGGGTEAAGSGFGTLAGLAGLGAGAWWLGRRGRANGDVDGASDASSEGETEGSTADEGRERDRVGE